MKMTNDAIVKFVRLWDAYCAFVKASRSLTDDEAELFYQTLEKCEKEWRIKST